MIDSTCYHNKKHLYKIAGQTKPFVDRNLQLHVPEWEAEAAQNIPLSASSIYSYYSCSPDLSIPFLKEFNEVEFLRAMDEAEQSYKAWKTAQQQLQQLFQT